MELSNGERLILAMLAELYKSNKVKGEIDPDFVLTSIYNNQTWGLAWKYPGICRNDGKNPPIVDETCAILDMYRRLSTSLAELSAADVERIEKEAYPFNDYVKFQGFDFNNDPHASVVDHLVHALGRYTEVNPDLNSHSSATLGHYRAMLVRLEGLPSYPVRLNADQIITILKG